MTQVDVLYRYGAQPTEAHALGIARLREVYGIRRVDLQEAQKTILVEYDSSRLTEQVIHQLLRRAGLDLIERVALTNAPPPPRTRRHDLVAISRHPRYSYLVAPSNVRP